MTYIYCLIDPLGGHYPNEPRYVGKADRPVERLEYGHLGPCGLEETAHRSSWLKSLLSKGLKPCLHVLQRIPDGYHETWQEAERKWIMLFRLMGYHLTNMTEGGEGVSGYVPTKESNEKRRQAMLGFQPSEETRRKLSCSLTGHSVSVETRAKISGSLKGVSHPQTIETRRKISLSHMGMKASPESREKNRLSHLGRSSNVPIVGRKREIVCPVCDTKFERWFTHKEWNSEHHQKYCSRQCSGRAMREVWKVRPHPAKGRKVSDETRRKSSVARTRWWAVKQGKQRWVDVCGVP